MNQGEADRPHDDAATSASAERAERTAEVERQLADHRARIDRAARGGYFERSTSWVTRATFVIVAVVLAALFAIWLLSP